MVFPWIFLPADQAVAPWLGIAGNDFSSSLIAVEAYEMVNGTVFESGEF